MKIGVITQWYDPESGSAAIPGSIVRALAAHGHDLEVVTGFPNYPLGRLYDGYRMRLLQRDRVDGIPVSRIPVFPSHDGSGARRALTYLAFMLSASTMGAFLVRRAEVVLVVATSGTVSFSGVIARLLWRRRYVLYIQDLWPDSVLASGMVRGLPARIAERLLHALCNVGYRHATRIVVISPGMRDVLISRGVPAEKVTVAANWADEAVFRPVTVERAPGERRSLMYAGNIGDVQGLEVLVEALAQVPAGKRPLVRLVGSGFAEQRLRALATELGVAEDLRWEGVKPFAEMAGVLATADAQIITLRDLPVFRATMPSKTQGILACGRPLIVSAPGDVAALARAAGAGPVVPPADARALADALRWLSDATDDELARCGAAGRAYYDEHLSTSVGVAALDEALLATYEVAHG
ncbi:glycosyltransferase family 4 protein [Nocardioides jejuensis]|uniref:Glycosyltransferase WbuB n=1 Tax=Nocardioides jejuensis TaxID=2502782 RepID=A0A4R1CJ62_9ACTN|nr:glycosyltransferase family 4 protein [Nocardioides jejuensis]TCJ30216.1 glycosyltransferase WbuB [Nocardioides jejuensis]